MQETFDGFHVVCTQHPAEVVVELEVGRGARSLVHGADDVRTANTHTGVKGVSRGSPVLHL